MSLKVRLPIESKTFSVNAIVSSQATEIKVPSSVRARPEIWALCGDGSKRSDAPVFVSQRAEQ